MHCSSRRFLTLISALGAVACSTPAAGPTGTGGTTADTADAAPAEDAAGADTGASDTGASDTGASDTGASDTGASDTGASDTGVADAGTLDATNADTGVGPTDAASDTGILADGKVGDAVIADVVADVPQTGDAVADVAVADAVGDAVKTDSAQAEVGATDAAVDSGPTVTPSATIVKLPYSQDFACGAAAPAGWVFDAPTADGLGWAIDATPKPPGFQSPDCSLNYNNGKDFQCPTGAKTLSAVAIGPMIDATAFAAGVPLQLRMAIAGSWENNSYDNLDLEVSTDDAKWVVVKSYDAPSSGWSTVTEDLSKYAGTKFRLRLRFWTSDCAMNTGVGAFVDDWKVYDATCKANAECDDGNLCTDDTCDTGTGKCSNKNNTVTCDDANGCTNKDACSAGKCTGTPDNTATCDDANPCTEKDACTAGKCTGTAIKCDDSNSCTDDACVVATGACTNKPKTDGAYCSDSDPCTTGESCNAGACTGSKGACDDGNPCTTDVCTKKDAFTKSCVSTPAAEGATCTDGLTCTTSDTCKAGICAGSDTCKTTAFTDAFDCATPKGWTLDPVVDKVGWGIDATPAVPAPKSGTCTLNFNNGTDYDNGTAVAGSAVSPIIDLTAAGAVSLAFWSYSGVEDTSAGYDQRFVEILIDGKVVQTQQLLALADIGKWVPIQIDLTAQAGKKIQVRFRFDSKDDIGNNAPGWFVDDVAVRFAGN